MFGPKARVDAKKKQLVLEQGVTDYKVRADISVPAWWQKVRFDVDTRWIGNWNDGQLTGDGVEKGKPIDVALPMNRSDLDGLTTYLAQTMTGQPMALTRIQRIEPTSLSTCATDLQVQIYGANLWRDPRVFLGGVEATNGTVTVLPDMEGVSASFSGAALRTLSNKQQGAPKLAIWTRNGHDEIPVDLTGSSDATACKDAASPKPPALSTESAKINVITPGDLSVCDKDASFIVDVSGMTQVTNALLGSVSAGRQVYSVGPPGDGHALFRADFHDLKGRNQGQSKVALVVSGKADAPAAVDQSGKSVPAKPIGVVATGSVNIVATLDGCGTKVAAIDALKVFSGTGQSIDVCTATANMVLSGPGAETVTSASLMNVNASLAPSASTHSIGLTFANLPVFGKTSVKPSSVNLHIAAPGGARDFPLTTTCSAS